MSLAKLTEIRRRLDALREGRAPALGIVERARAALGRYERLGAVEELRALDRELDKVGIHTAADARLLRKLGASRGRAGELAAGLRARAARALVELEEALGRAERAAGLGQPIPGAATQLERDFPKLARAVKVADIFAAVEEAEPRFEIFGAAPPAWSSPSHALLEIARFWADRAQANVDDLFQRRRDLDGAHELLLRIGAGLDRDRARELRLRVSDARARAHGIPAVRSIEDLLRHVRVAGRKDPGAAYKSLRALYERAVEAGEPRVAGAAHDALEALLPEPAALGSALARAELEAAGLEPAAGPAPREREEDALAKLALELDEERLATFELAAGCARYFDVEDALSEVVVEAEVHERRPVARRVPYPTQQMNFDLTGRLDELPNFVLTDPRTLLYDLASNRQLVRTYVDEAPPPKPRRLKRTAVRVYVCDASGSMHGPRARFRDALLISELNNLRRRAQRGEEVDPVYYCFFNDRPTSLARVDTEAEATRHIEKLLLRSPAEGQTQITMALVAAFDAIRAAQGRDPYLARATVVLVTDGEDRIDLELIRATRAPVGMVDIALSFISLGEENPDLKALAREQREKGGRAFYQHLTDAEIGTARTDFDTRFRTLLPPDVPATADALEKLLPHLEALEQVARDRPAPAPVQDASFDAVFPAPPEETVAMVKLDPQELARIAEMLDAIAEAASLAPADQRGTEAVTLLHHLLGVYGLPLPRYLGALEAPPPPVRKNLDRLRLVCRPFG